MSLLEDVFLEDEAGEAQELERIIEGDEYDERPRPDSNENSEKEDEAEEDKRHVDPTSAKPKRVVKNPRVILNPARLTGPRGIQVIPEHFKDFTFKGKGHEKEDLDLVLKKLEHWAYRLFPKFEFKDCLKKMETLGNKRPVMVHLTKIRTDQFISEETVVQRDSSDDEPGAEPGPEPEPEDEFDKLLQQQIELARATPAPGTANKGLTTPMMDKSLIMPTATSSPSINDEQRERMLRNRQLAEERRLARLKLNNSETRHENSNTETNTILESSTNDILKDVSYNNSSKDERNGNSIATNTAEIKNTDDEPIWPDVEENVTKAKSYRSNVIDSSDSEDGGLVINESVSVDVHNHRNWDSDKSDSGHQYENRNTDMVNQNENFEEIHSDVVCLDENEQDSDIVHKKGKKQQNENERNSDIDNQNENNVEEIGDKTTDVEMNDIINVSESKSNKTEELDCLNILETNNKDPNLDIEEIVKNNEDSEMLQSNDNSSVDSKQISEHENNLKNVVDSSTKITKIAEENTETALTDVADVMDLDFSDDF